MADNTTLNPGTGGDVMAADDITGVKFQRVKIALGADGANDGDVSAANPIPTTNAPATGSTTSPSNSTTTAYAASLIVKASAGKLFSLSGYNSKTTGQFIQLHDSATLPADTAVPKVIFYVPATLSFSYDIGGTFGRFFTTGIVICNSSTGPTKTIGAADCWFDAQYL